VIRAIVQVPQIKDPQKRTIMKEAQTIVVNDIQKITKRISIEIDRWILQTVQTITIITIDKSTIKATHRLLQIHHQKKIRERNQVHLIHLILVSKNHHHQTDQKKKI